jgi:hypothetical protein
MTDDPVISADCAMTDDLSISARVIVWVVCIPTVTILTGKTLDSAVMTTRAEKYH